MSENGQQARSGNAPRARSRGDQGVRSASEGFRWRGGSGHARFGCGVVRRVYTLRGVRVTQGGKNAPTSDDREGTPCGQVAVECRRGLPRPKQRRAPLDALRRFAHPRGDCRNPGHCRVCGSAVPPAHVRTRHGATIAEEQCSDGHDPTVGRAASRDLRKPAFSAPCRCAEPGFPRTASCSVTRSQAHRPIDRSPSPAEFDHAPESATAGDVLRRSRDFVHAHEIFNSCDGRAHAPAEGLTLGASTQIVPSARFIRLWRNHELARWSRNDAWSAFFDEPRIGDRIDSRFADSEVPHCASKPFEVVRPE